MCKFYSLLRVVSLFCLTTLFNQGPLFSQQAWVSGYSSDINQDYYYEMIWNGSEYSYEGFLSGYAYVSTNDDPYIGADGGNLFFPSGNLYSDNGNPEPIPSGYYILTLNTATGDYIFETSSNCYGSSSQVSLVIYGSSSAYYCDEGILSAYLTIDEYYFESYVGLDFQWFRNGIPIPGANEMFLNIYPSSTELETYTFVATCPLNNQTVTSNEWITSLPEFTLEVSDPVLPVFCESINLNSELVMDGTGTGIASDGAQYQWLRNGAPIPGATNADLPNVAPSSSEESIFTLLATCPFNGETLVSNEVTLPACFDDSSSPLNYLLIQNVATTGNIPGQSIQVQFDLNWGNTWKDDVNWDAAWVFMKYKDANGVWQHAKVSPTGFDHGEGTPNLIEPTADQMGAFVRLAIEGQGNFNAEGMQLRWNYGADGLSSVSGLEVRVYAIEMVYTPQGDFSVTNGPAPGGKTPVINTRLSPPLNLWGTMRVKGDAGLDTDANGTVDNTIYPTGYYSFYMFKYEMSDQQYADFLNCLTPAQRAALGWGGTITETAGQYFAAAPNRACDFSNTQRLLAYSDWAGLRPLSYLEFEKGFHGPKPPQDPNAGRECCGDASGNSGSGVFGAKDMTGNVREPIVIMTSNTFDRNIHGNGILSASGPSDVISWGSLGIDWLGYGPWWSDSGGRLGFRLCRTAE